MSWKHTYTVRENNNKKKACEFGLKSLLVFIAPDPHWCGSPTKARALYHRARHRLLSQELEMLKVNTEEDGRVPGLTTPSCPGGERKDQQQDNCCFTSNV